MAKPLSPELLARLNAIKKRQEFIRQHLAEIEFAIMFGTKPIKESGEQ